MTETPNTYYCDSKAYKLISRLWDISHEKLVRVWQGSYRNAEAEGSWQDALERLYPTIQVKNIESARKLYLDCGYVFISGYYFEDVGFIVLVFTLEGPSIFAEKKAAPLCESNQ